MRIKLRQRGSQALETVLLIAVSFVFAIALLGVGRFVVRVVDQLIQLITADTGLG